MTINDEKKSRRISVDLPEHLIDEFDALKKEWGLRSRGAVFTRLLEYVLPNEDNDEIAQQAGIKGTPTVHLFHLKELKREWMGVKKRSEFKEAIDSLGFDSTD